MSATELPDALLLLVLPLIVFHLAVFTLLLWRMLRPPQPGEDPGFGEGGDGGPPPPSGPGRSPGLRHARSERGFPERRRSRPRRERTGSRLIR